jgi:hypothetical protein
MEAQEGGEGPGVRAKPHFYDNWGLLVDFEYSLGLFSPKTKMSTEAKNEH